MTPLYLDVPRAIPAADPFNVVPEPAEIGIAMQEQREKLVSDGVDPVDVEALLQIWAPEALGVEDHRPVPDMPAGEGWRLQPRDEETGQWVAKEDQ